MTLLAREHAVQMLDFRLGNVEKSVQGMQDTLHHMQSQAVIDKQEAKNQFTTLFAKLSPLLGIPEENSGRGTNTAAPQFQPPSQSTGLAPAAPRETAPLQLDLSRARLGLQTEVECQQLPHTVPTLPTDSSQTTEQLRNVHISVRDSAEAHGRAELILGPHGTKPAAAINEGMTAEGEADMSEMVLTDPDLLVLRQQASSNSHQTKAGEVRVLQYDGDSASFSI